eukprot:1139699-Pelagomonas_calceolata.AAC.1
MFLCNATAPNFCMNLLCQGIRLSLQHPPMLQPPSNCRDRSQGHSGYWKPRQVISGGKPPAQPAAGEGLVDDDTGRLVKLTAALWRVGSSANEQKHTYLAGEMCPFRTHLTLPQ